MIQVNHCKSSKQCRKLRKKVKNSLEISVLRNKYGYHLSGTHSLMPMYMHRYIAKCITLHE